MNTNWTATERKQLYRYFESVWIFEKPSVVVDINLVGKKLLVSAFVQSVSNCFVAKLARGAFNFGEANASSGQDRMNEEIVFEKKNIYAHMDEE